MKYVYMGFSTRSSNFALPTSRLVLMLKRRIYRRREQQAGGAESKDIPAACLEYERPSYGLLWAVGRFVNRLAEAFYRQAISSIYEMRGYLVVYDRHLLFDSACEIESEADGQADRFDRIYHWILRRWLRMPDLTIFLDAPAAVLLKRKGEMTSELINRRRDVYLEMSRKAPAFVRVDASRSPDQVLVEVTSHILRLPALKKLRG